MPYKTTTLHIKPVVRHGASVRMHGSPILLTGTNQPILVNMKKTIIFAALAIMMASCTTPEAQFDMSAPVVTNTPAANTATFDETENARVELMVVCKDLIRVHKDFDYFRELLTSDQLKAIDTDKYDLDMAVSIVYAWWGNERTFDVLCEWPSFDDFIPLVTLLSEYDKYGFYW